MDGEAGTAQVVDTAALAQIEPMLQKAVDEGVIAGAVTLVWRYGEELQFCAVGERNIEKKLPMTRDTLFRIASMTKPITAVAALMLMEEGRLSLADPITKWAPEFAGMRVLKDPQGPLAETYPSPREITIEDLFTHRGGLAQDFSSVGPIAHAHHRALGDTLNSDMDPDAWIEALASLPLSFPPGERFHYGHASDLLGLIVGRIGGRGFRQFLIERIFEPLGMSDTDFYVPAAKRARAAEVYRWDEAQGGLVPVAFIPQETPPQFAPGGGGLISTLDDYLKFARMLLNEGELDGRRYLKPETVRLMRTDRLTPAQREVPFMNIPWWQGHGLGLSLMVVTEPEKQIWMGAASKGAFGWPGAFGTSWQASPQDGLILIYLIQEAMSLAPEAVAEPTSEKHIAARTLLPMFEKQAYAAIGK
jgi:CubicO group peptidase (beta-lactamase class C family)